MSSVLRPTFCIVLFCIVYTIFNFFSVRPIYLCKPMVIVLVSGLNFLTMN